MAVLRSCVGANTNTYHNMYYKIFEQKILFSKNRDNALIHPIFFGPRVTFSKVFPLKILWYVFLLPDK